MKSCNESIDKLHRPLVQVLKYEHVYVNPIALSVYYTKNELLHVKINQQATTQYLCCSIRMDNNRIFIYCLCSFSPPSKLRVSLLHVFIVSSLRYWSFSGIWRRNIRRGHRRRRNQFSTASILKFLEFLATVTH